MDRTKIINWLIDYWGFNTYLEIGIADGENWKEIRCPSKTGVDPAVTGENIWSTTSDEFFEKIPGDTTFDLIFIDGWHQEDQVDKDFLNSLQHLAPGGRIVMHDVNPENPEWEHPNRNGTAWRSWSKLRMTRPDLTMYVVDCDYGCGVVRRGGQVLYPLRGDFDFRLLSQDRKALLNLIPPEEFPHQEKALKGLVAEKLVW